MLSGFSQFDTTGKLPECNDKKMATDLFQRFEQISYTNKDDWLSQCPQPCKQNYYTLNTASYDPTITLDDQTLNSTFFLGLAYDTFITERETEKLYYDTFDILALVGGNLGLFLGFSCFSSLLTVTELLSNIPNALKNIQQRLRTLQSSWTAHFINI